MTDHLDVWAIDHWRHWARQMKAALRTRLGDGWQLRVQMIVRKKAEGEEQEPDVHDLEIAMQHPKIDGAVAILPIENLIERGAQYLSVEEFAEDICIDYVAAKVKQGAVRA